jgi:hypothetical protein
LVRLSPGREIAPQQAPRVELCRNRWRSPPAWCHRCDRALLFRGAPNFEPSSYQSFDPPRSAIDIEINRCEAPDSKLGAVRSQYKPIATNRHRTHFSDIVFVAGAFGLHLESTFGITVFDRHFLQSCRRVWLFTFIPLRCCTLRCWPLAAEIGAP